ncbi:MAG: hypothetical protein WBO31_01240 [Saprospiraceae bacterium]|nr:hypothetical protein [Saprospiraceae bacterium]
MERNRGFILHVLSYSWVLFLIGFGLLAWFHGLGLDRKLKENTALAIELKPNLSNEATLKFQKWLTDQAELIPGSLQHITQGDYASLLANELVGDSLDLSLNKLLPEIFIFKLKQDFLSKDRLKVFEEKVYSQNSVQNFSFQNELTSDLSKSVERIRIGFLAMTLLFVLVGFLISDYLAQVFVDSRTAIIKNWNELGATEEKILAPYLKRVIYLALASACLSVCMLGLIVLLSYYLVPWTASWLETKKFLWVMCILLILGPTLQYVLVKRKIQLLIN